MTPNNLNILLNRLLEREGGLSDQSNDHGGITNFGLTKDFLEDLTQKSWTPELIKVITMTEAKELYTLWFQKLHFTDLPDDLNLLDSIIDYAVNSGSSPAIRALQKAVGETPDGVIGPKTLIAISKFSNLSIIRNRILANRLRLFGNIISKDSTQAKFAAGWLNRIASQIEMS